MSRGLGKTERLILAYLGGCDEDGCRHCQSGGGQVHSMAFILTLPPDQWRELDYRLYAYRHATRSELTSCLRAVKSLERKGLVTTHRKRSRKLSCDGPGRRDYLVVTLSADQSEELPNSQRLQEQRA